MKKLHFVARMPNTPGALHRAAEIARNYNGNIDRIHYDERLDAGTVFFEVTVPSDDEDLLIREGLQRLGYLQESLEPTGFIKFNLYLSNRPGALFDFLNYVTDAQANIAFIDFDERGLHSDRVTVGLTAKKTLVIDDLLNELKSCYRIDIIEYDRQGAHLDDTVTYLRFAQRLRALLGADNDDFLLKLLCDSNHIVQELSNLDQDPKLVLDSIAATGETLQATTGDGFYADVQRLALPDATLFCFQLPCGGNIFAIDTADECVLVDTGYGLYYDDVMRMIDHYIPHFETKLVRILATHADADHIGSSARFNVPMHIHRDAIAVIDQANRAYGSDSSNIILEEVYTKLINLFSDFAPAADLRPFASGSGGMRGPFPVIDTVSVGPFTCEVLEGLGGHVHGQVFFFSPEHRVLFTGDSLINFPSFTEERKQFNTLARILMTSVNVDSAAAARERDGLLALARDASRAEPCFVCGGHGAVSVVAGDGLEPAGITERYTHRTVF